jgi:hypothetical protein
MPTTCHCGMTHEHASPRLACRECGTATCPSCAIKVDTQTYCRWCATTLTRVA